MKFHCYNFLLFDTSVADITFVCDVSMGISKEINMFCDVT